MADAMADSTPSRPSAVVMFFKRIGEVSEIVSEWMMRTLQKLYHTIHRVFSAVKKKKMKISSEKNDIFYIGSKH